MHRQPLSLAPLAVHLERLEQGLSSIYYDIGSCTKFICTENTIKLFTIAAVSPLTI